MYESVYKKVILMMVTSIIIGFTAVYDGNYFSVIKKEKEILNHFEYLPIYYNYVSQASESRGLSLYDGLISHDINEKIDKKISEYEKVKNVYSYNALYFMNYYNYYDETKDCFSTAIQVDDKEVMLNSAISDKPFMIIPYYKEDGLDQNLSKVFISKALNDVLNGAVGKTVDISTINVPISQTKSTSIKNGEEVESNVIDYKTIAYTFTIDEELDYYSHLYDSEYVILVPYTVIDELIYQNANDANDPYVSPIHIVYCDTGNIKDVIDFIDEVDYSTRYINYSIVFSSTFSIIREMMRLPIIIGNILLLTTLAVCIYHFRKNAKKENYFFILTVVIGGFITSFIFKKMLNTVLLMYYSMIYSILFIVLCGFVLLGYNYFFKKE